MTSAQWAALVPSVIALLTAITGIIAWWQHTHGPAHQTPPAAPPTNVTVQPPAP